ncbi:MAG: hypothetical protein AAF383_03875 [Cyanobacteria bacterium P01_A01_bin.83]
MEKNIMGISQTQTLTSASSVSVITLNFPSFGNPNAERSIEITFNFDAGTVAWRNRIFKVNERLIAARKVYSDKGFSNSDYEYLTVVITVEETMKLMMKTVRSFKQANSAINFLNELVGTVLISNWEIDERDITSYNLSAIQPETDNTRDAQQVLRDYDVVGFEFKSSGLMGKGLWVEGCLEIATKHWGFALPDKTNKKRAKVADAVVVSGRSVDGTKSIVHSDKAEKQLNRETMLKHIAAELPVVHEDALVSELHDGKFAVSYGLADYSLLLNDPLLSLAVGDAGIVNREPINYVANKLLRGGINLELLFSGNPEYHAELSKRVKSLSLSDNRTAQVQAVMEDVRAEMKAHELNETVLQPGETIEFKGQAVIANFNTFPVRVHKVKSVRRGAFINTECRSLVVEIHTKAEFEDYNAKLRGQWIKGMTTRNDDYAVVDSSGETVDARFILNHNSVKNEKAVSLRGWANKEGQRIAWTQNGELRYVEEDSSGKWVLGNLVDLAAVEAEIANLTEEYDVEQIVSRQDLETFRGSNPEAFAGVEETEIGNSLVKLNYKAKGFVAPLVFAIELSSVPENLSVNRRLASNATSYLTTFPCDGLKKVTEHNSKLVKSLRLAGKNHVDARFNLDRECQAQALRDVLSDLVKSSSRDLLKQLGDKYPHGFKVEGSVNGSRKWNVTIPARLLTVLSHFNKTGFSTDNKVVEVHAFLSLVANADSCPHLIAEYVFRLGSSLENWKDDVNSREKAFVKGSPLFTTHGMKVLANSQAGYESVNDVEVPVIWINSNNPLVVGTVDKNGKKVKQVKDGDVVLFYRNPVVDLTPAIIRFNDKACGNFTCAVSPSVLAWSSQTDNDGDTLWIVPLKQVRISSIDTEGKRGDEVRNSIASMMNHPLVGKEIAVEAMKTFGAGDLFAGIIKPRDNFGADVHAVVGDSNPDIIELAEAVANHYTVRVGQGYSLMFNAFNSFTTKFHQSGYDAALSSQMEAFDHAEIVAIKASSFVFYEEFGLAGFSAGNESQFAKLTKSALERLGKNKISSSGLLTRKNKGGNKNPWFYASKFRAQSIIQSQTELCKYFGDVELKFGTSESQQIKLEALNNGLFRTLTKGHLNQDGIINGIFSSLSVDMIAAAHPFAEAMIAWQEFVNDGLVS